ncbi:MAG: L-histidine N(alpha)-methyltransferase [Bdellovibrionia bacterium]
MTKRIVKNSRMLEEVLEGLHSIPKKLSPKHFYDKRGAELFDQLCTLEEYYPTRTEISILETYMGDISASLGRRPILYEFGSGSSTKIQILLNNIKDIVGYVPIDICPEYLKTSVEELRRKFPNLAISPICADFSEKVELVDSITRAHRDCGRVVFFPGSTIGNFTSEEAVNFLHNAASTLGARGKLLIGVDMIKDVAVLERAYNDSGGVTAEFNLNILHRINRELGADFNPSSFHHRAFFNRHLSRIEMHLVCSETCQISIREHVISFKAGESIHTESSYKYEFQSFVALAERSGFRFLRRWTDTLEYFNVLLFEV